MRLQQVVRLTAVCVLFAGCMAAQTVQATLTGRVTDTSGGGVPNVTVQVRNVETNQLTSVLTDRTGQYTAPYLQPGQYSVTVEAPGFKKLLRDGAKRTTDALWQLCGQVLDLFTESECRNYFRHCGYRYS